MSDSLLLVCDQCEDAWDSLMRLSTDMTAIREALAIIHESEEHTVTR